METPDKTKSPWGGFTCCPGSTNDQSLSFVRIQYHAPVITPLLNPIAKSLREALTAGMSAGFRTTASSVESSA